MDKIFLQKYRIFCFNDGGIPWIIGVDSIEEAHENLSYVHHWMIVDNKTSDIVEISDLGTQG